jgi:hypothetical protein
MNADAEIIALWRRCESEVLDAAIFMRPTTDNLTLDRVFTILTKLRNATAAIQDIERRMNGVGAEK